MAISTLEQISKKLDELDVKVSALLVKEEKPTKNELSAIKHGEKQFAQGKFTAWKKIKAEHT